MEKCTELLKEYLQGKRDISKKSYILIGTLYRGVNSGRFTYEQGLQALDKLGK